MLTLEPGGSTLPGLGFCLVTLRIEKLVAWLGLDLSPRRRQSTVSDSRHFESI